MGRAMQPTTLIIRTAGTNCDRELAHAFELAGATTEKIHINRLIAEPGLIDRFDLIGVPGGFSYGDDIAAGRIFANRMKHRLMGPMQAAVRRGVPIIGICNGFQVLVKMGLLPEPEAGRQCATLADNTNGRFVDRWIGLRVPEDTVCIWTRGLTHIELPIAHGEGRFVPESDQLLAKLKAGGQVAVRYAPMNDRAGARPDGAAYNPNGSVDDIAGICDPSGVVFGLMPHPERFAHPTHHPMWTRLGEAFMNETPEGLRIIANAVEHVKGKVAVGAG